MKYVLGIDQSTQGTKVLVFDEQGSIISRVDRPHAQLVNEKGWVSHDPEEIWQNLKMEISQLVQEIPELKYNTAAIGISNQRETSVIWDDAGKPVMPAIVWQCGRAAELIGDITDNHPDAAEMVKQICGLNISPYFSAAKMAWFLHRPEVQDSSGIHLGTMDSYLVYRMTEGKCFITDAGNASRTQLMDLVNLSWSSQLCDLFAVPMEMLPLITDSSPARYQDSTGYPMTDLEGILVGPVPVSAILGDSHAALFGHGCTLPGMAKVTYGTGSSIMMNTGNKLIHCKDLASCAAWMLDGMPAYCLEGNINYTGAVISWLKDNVQLIGSVSELEPLVLTANPEDNTVLVPAFTGLSAPYWENGARASITNMSRTTGRAEIAAAALRSIAFQINDVLESMNASSGMPLREIRVDGGPTRNRTLMQFQSDISGCDLLIPEHEELSAMGAAYMAGINTGLYNEEEVRNRMSYVRYSPSMSEADRERYLSAWHAAVEGVVAAARY